MAPSGWVVVTLVAAQFMTTLDTSIVNVALPDMQRELGMTRAGVQSVVTAYLLVLGGFLLLSGRLSDVLDARQLLRGGLIVFAVASAVGELAWSPVVLIATRGGQGLGAALLTSTALALITRLFTDPTPRRRMLSRWSATGSIGFACGAILGGVLVQWLSWRAVLLVNVPLCAVAAIGTFRISMATAPSGPASRGLRGVGIAGAVLATSAASAWMFALSWGPTYGWMSPGTWAGVTAGIALTAMFVLGERRSQDPLVPIRLLAVPGVIAANVVMLAFGIAATSGVWLVISLFLQHVADYSPLRTGMAFLPLALIAAAAAPAGPWLQRRYATRTLLIAGLIIVSVGLGLLSQLQPSSGYVTGLLPGMLCVGGGFVLVLLTTVAIATVNAPEHQRGVASGLVNTTAQFAGALGAALYVTLARANDGLNALLPFTLAAVLLGSTALLTAWRFPMVTRQPRPAPLEGNG
jgi:MFS family permease